MTYLRRPPAPVTFTRAELRNWSRGLGLDVHPWYCREHQKVTPRDVRTGECRDCEHDRALEQHRRTVA